MATILYYVHDPMCSWCYGLGPVWTAVQRKLPAEVSVHRLLGGLAPDSDEPMPAEMRERLQEGWRRIERTVPEIRFNFTFWERCTPRRSTYPSCRAVIAAREQGDAHDEEMTRAIQRAYYQEARNPSDESTLVELAGEIGLDPNRFAATLNSPETESALQQEIDLARRIGVDSFPSLVLAVGESRWPVGVDYRSPEPILDTLAFLLEEM